MPRLDWTREENEAIVSVYFEMLRAQARGAPFEMSNTHRALMDGLKRNKASIRAKNCNISSVMRGLAEIWVTEYGPLARHQATLADVVHGHLLRAPDIIDNVSDEDSDVDHRLRLETAPTLSNEPSSEHVERIMLTARRFGVAARDENNRRLRAAGRRRAIGHERRRLIDAGRERLAERVSLVCAEDQEDPGFDIASFEENGSDRLLKVKTTKGIRHIPFHVDGKEVKASEERRDAWRLFRIFDFNQKPRAFELRPPLDRHVALFPTSFRAEFMDAG